jgi:hypothetical protein
VAHDGHPSPALGVGRVTDYEAEGSEIDPAHSLVGACGAILPAHRRHRVTPFMEQTWQMNVPHP